MNSEATIVSLALLTAFVLYACALKIGEWWRSR